MGDNKIKSRIETKLTEAMENLTDFYVDKIKANEMSDKEQKNFIQLLKDNSINIEVKSGTPLADLLGDDDFDDMEESYQSYN